MELPAPAPADTRAGVRDWRVGPNRRRIEMLRMLELQHGFERRQRK